MNGKPGHVLHRNLRTDLPLAVRGEGPYLFDAAGRRYLDASGGAAVSCLGHSCAPVIDAIVRQARELAYAHTSFFTNRAAEQLAAFLAPRAPGNLTRVEFVCDGSEAVEAALKLARQYWIESGEPSRTRIVSRRLSYHGNTLGALSVSGHTARRSHYEPYLFDDCEFIDACYPYRQQRSGESAEEYAHRAANELAVAIERSGPKRVAAFVAEPVVGATAGCLTAPPGYFKHIREICDKHGVLLIADEVMCGMGRTGTLLACEQEGVAPDLLAIGKGLAGGYQPIGAVLVSERIVSAIERGSGALSQGHTYMAHPVACAAALAVQQTIESGHLLDNVRRTGALLERRLRETFGAHPHVGDIRGRGLFWALELVRDAGSKEPFDPAWRLHARIKQLAMGHGMICYPSGGTADGVRGDHVLLAPPYIIAEEHVEQIVSALAETLDAVFAERRS